MIFEDIEDISYVAFYTAIQDRSKNGYLYQRLYTTIPLLIDANSYEEAKEIAKSKINNDLFLNEVIKINIKDKNNILNFYK